MSKCFVFLVSILFIVLGPTLLWADTLTKADFDESGTVGFQDFLQFASAYGTNQTRYDLNGNGTVDFQDFLAFASVFGQSVSSTIITFADINLEAVNKPKGYILPTDVSELTKLSAKNKNIRSLKGIESLTALTKLELPSNQISDLTPLSSLTALNELYLRPNHLSDDA